MKVIKGSTVRGQKMFENNLYSIGENLSDVYNNYSWDKYQAYNNCKEKYYNENGINFRITGKNSSFFTVAWDIVNEYKQIIGVRIETAYNSYYIDLAQ